MPPGDGPESAAVTHTEVHLSKDRVGISLALEVTGGDLQGMDFIEQATTKLVSRRGAAIIIDRLLAPEQILTIKCLRTQQEAEVRVIGLMGSEAGRKLYGVAFLNPAANIWGIDFAGSEAEETQAKLLLECSTCHMRQIAVLTELELSVFRASRSLTRDCPKCRDATRWKQSLYNVPSGPEPAPAAPAVPLAKSAVNRRKHPRVKVEMKGSILFHGQETPIQVLDTSRGGVRFRSARNYADDLLVRVAIPYTPGAANIFVPARIRRCRLLPSGESEGGLEYVKE